MVSRWSSASESPFDHLAESYDEAFSESPLGTTLRTAVWRRLEAVVRPGGSVLELGCGTGVDARLLAEAGMSVVAIDASSKMVETARHRCRHLTNAVRVEHGDLAHLDAIPDCAGPFDLALSDFGALNCIDDLALVMGSITDRLTTGGRVVAVIMGRVVPWEWVWMIMSGRPTDAFRRLRSGGVEWRGQRIHYHTPGTVRRAAATAGLKVQRIAGLGALLPITEAGPWISRHSRLLSTLDRLERRFETIPPLPWLADHLLVELERP